MKTRVSFVFVAIILAMLIISCDKQDEVDCGAVEKKFNSKVALLEVVYDDYPSIDDSDGLDGQECTAFSEWISSFLTKTEDVVAALEQGKSCAFTKDYLVEMGYENDQFDTLITDLNEALRLLEDELKNLCN